MDKALDASNRLSNIIRHMAYLQIDPSISYPQSLQDYMAECKRILDDMYRTIYDLFYTKQPRFVVREMVRGYQSMSSEKILVSLDSINHGFSEKRERTEKADEKRRTTEKKESVSKEKYESLLSHGGKDQWASSEKKSTVHTTQNYLYSTATGPTTSDGKDLRLFDSTPQKREKESLKEHQWSNQGSKEIDKNLFVDSDYIGFDSTNGKHPLALAYQTGEPGDSFRGKAAAKKRYGKQRYRLNNNEETEYNTPNEERITLVDESDAKEMDRVTDRPSIYVRVIRPHTGEETILKARYRSHNPNYSPPTKMTVKSHEKRGRSEEVVKFGGHKSRDNFRSRNESDELKRSKEFSSVEKLKKEMEDVPQKLTAEQRLKGFTTVSSFDEENINDDDLPGINLETYEIESEIAKEQKTAGFNTNTFNSKDYMIDEKTEEDQEETFRFRLAKKKEESPEAVKKMHHPLYLGDSESNEIDLLNQPYMGIIEDEEPKDVTFDSNPRDFTTLTDPHHSKDLIKIEIGVDGNHEMDNSSERYRGRGNSSENRHLKTITEEDSSRIPSYKYESVSINQFQNQTPNQPISENIVISDGAEKGGLDKEALNQNEEESDGQSTSLRFSMKEHDPSFLSLEGPVTSLKFQRSINSVEMSRRAFYPHTAKIHGVLMASQYLMNEKTEIVFKEEKKIELFDVLDDGVVVTFAEKKLTKFEVSLNPLHVETDQEAIRVRVLEGGKFMMVEKESNDLVVFESDFEEVFRFSKKSNPKIPETGLDSPETKSKKENEYKTEVKDDKGFKGEYENQGMNVFWENSTDSLFMVNSLSGVVAEYPKFWSYREQKCTALFMSTTSNLTSIIGVGRDEKSGQFSLHYCANSLSSETSSNLFDEGCFHDIAGIACSIDNSVLLIAGRWTKYQGENSILMPGIKVFKFNGSTEVVSSVELDDVVGNELVNEEDGPIIDFTRMKNDNVFFAASSRSIFIICYESRKPVLIRRIQMEEDILISKIKFDGISLYFSCQDSGVLRRMTFETLARVFYSNSFRSPVSEGLLKKCKAYVSSTAETPGGKVV